MTEEHFSEHAVHSTLPVMEPGGGTLPAVHESKNQARRTLVACTLVICAMALVAIAAVLIWQVYYVKNATAEAESSPSVFALLNVLKEEPRLFRDSEQAKWTEQDFERYKRAQAASIKTRFVLNTALGKPGISQLKLIKQQADPLAWLEKNLQVDYLGDSEILRIGLIGDRSEDRARIVNAVTEAFLQESVNKESKKRSDRLNQLKALYEQYDERIRAKRQALRAVTEAVGQEDPIHAKVRLILLTEAAAELHGVRFRMLTARVKIQRQAHPVVGATTVVGWGTAMRQGSFLAVSTLIAGTAAFGDRPVSDRLAEELAILARQEKSLNDYVMGLIKEGRKPGGALRLADLRQEIELTEKTLKKIVAELEALEVERASPPRISLREEAAGPEHK